MFIYEWLYMGMSVLFVAIIAKLIQFRSRIVSNTLDKYKSDVVCGSGKESNSWAVITGATDGIGLCFAHELAQNGFNLILISRTLEKLEDVANTLHDTYGVETKILEHNFGTFDKTTHDNFYEHHLKPCILECDVGILVNNVGTSYDMPTKLHMLQISKISDIIMINMYATTRMTYTVLNNKFITRDNKSAVINVGSSSGTTPTPMLSVYSASKGYVRYLNECLSHEYPCVDFLNFAPGTLCTKMVGAKKPGLLVAEPGRVVKSALKRIGIVTQTNPYWVHFLLDIPACCFITKGIWLSYLTKQLQRARTRILNHKSKKKDSTND